MNIKDRITKLLKDVASWGEVEEAINEYVSSEKDGLTTKNTELVAEVRGLKRKLKDGASDETNELRTKLEQAEAANETLQVKFKDLSKKADKAEKLAQTETEAHNGTLIDNGLTNELVKLKIAPQFLEAAKALHRGSAAVKVDSDGKRSVLVGDKALAAHLSEWSQSDAGKAFVAAPNNNGGNANGGNNNSSGGKPNITRAQFDGMDGASRSAHFKAGGTIQDA